ncbi:TadE/TadG family type IV pilus assembly protein [Marimonas lutisalis]|uniref:TadE/TadG family type IV pilus assembly protein n=1 Tax=Marimonas lutisalis TaxID=2545756 RepID=UPI00195FE23F|nr:hypothetical protein [Marimonas lutisalis]
MMSPLRLFRARLGAFAAETRGSVTVEAVIMLPALFWAYCALYTFFDAYRYTGAAHKAAFTVSDAMSRETNPINDDYLDTTHELLGFLTRSGNPHRLRVTVVRYDEQTDDHYVEWSQTRGPISGITAQDASDWDDKLPGMVDEERLIVVETWTDYQPPFNIGLSESTIQTFVFTRPRFAPQLLYDANA